MANQTVLSKTELVNPSITEKQNLHTCYASSNDKNHAYRQAVEYLENWAIQKKLLRRNHKLAHANKCFGTRETIGVRKVHVITKEF